MRFLEIFNDLTSLLAVIDLEFRAQAMRRLLFFGLAAFAGIVVLALTVWWALRRRARRPHDQGKP